MNSLMLPSLFVISVVGLSVLFALPPTGSVDAHSGATGIVKERMDKMKVIGRATKSISEQLRGKEPYDPEKVKVLAKEVADHSGDAMTVLFPQNSLGHPTEALPEIWAEWAEFERLAVTLRESAQALQIAADNPQLPVEGSLRQQLLQGFVAAEKLIELPPEAAFIQIVQTCSACHDRFRLE